MTAPREIGNRAKLAVEQAAYLTNRAQNQLRQAIKDPNDATLLEVVVELQDALRWLESIGAGTQPREV